MFKFWWENITTLDIKEIFEPIFLIAKLFTPMLVVTLVECLLKATKYFRVFYSTMIREYFYFRGDDTCCHGRGKDSVTCF